MKHLIGYALSAIAGGVVAFLLGAFSDRSHVAPTYGYNYPMGAKLNSLEKRALMGDVSSSTKLTRQVNDCATLEEFGRGNKSGCSSAQRFWQIVDAENGGSDGMSATFLLLSTSQECVLKLRAIFWLSKLDALSGGKGASQDERDALRSGADECLK